MQGWRDIFTQRIEFDPTGDFESFCQQVPTKWTVYLLAGENDIPLQLLSVKNLRASLRRRLAEPDADEGLTRKIDYRKIVRTIYVRRVDSVFEADLCYLEAARELFPETYRTLLSNRPAWFVHINPDAHAPRFNKTQKIPATGVCFGPVQDKHSAQKLVELVEDAFDLCRYHSILAEWPNGAACAYKDMGKCPAPCDGTISMQEYRKLVLYSMSFLSDPASFVREHEMRMRKAAEAMEFELAEQIKQYVEQLSTVRKGPFRYLTPLSELSWIILQHGPTKDCVRLWVLVNGRMSEALAVIAPVDRVGGILRALLAEAESLRGHPLDEAGVERIGVLAKHLFAGKRREGAFLMMNDVDEKSLAKAIREAQKPPAQQAQADVEGVVSELEAM